MGGGKTFALVESARIGYSDANHRAIILRRHLEDARKSGNICDETTALYRPLGAHTTDNGTKHVFPSGATVTVGGCAHEKDIDKYLSAQPTTVCFDQAEQFTEKMFFQIGLGRARSAAGMKIRVIASANPVPERHKVGGWLARLLMDGGWVDRKTGDPVREMSGVIRYAYRPQTHLVFYDTADEAREAHPEMVAEGADPISVCFIIAGLDDNTILTEKDPGYRSRMMSLDHITRKRLLGGNWKADALGGGIVRREWFRVLDRDPSGGNRSHWTMLVRSWDFAWSESPTADRAACILSGQCKETGRIVFMDGRIGRYGTAKLEDLFVRTALEDGPGVLIRAPIDPAAGKYVHENLERLVLKAFADRGMPPPEMVWETPARRKASDTEESAKHSRGKPFISAAEPRRRDDTPPALAEYGKIDFVAGPDIEEFLDELHNFDGSENCADDAWDAVVDGYNMHIARLGGWVSMPLMG